MACYITSTSMHNKRMACGRAAGKVTMSLLLYSLRYGSVYS